jgi:uncharacterized protein
MYSKIKSFVFSQEYDLIHDKYHISRVLFNALDICESYTVNYDIIVAASLLHDIGRSEKYRLENVPHALTGAQLAYDFLLRLGWEDGCAKKVADCIRTHSFHGKEVPESIEAEILYDADKIDLTGSIGIARAMMFQRDTEEPLYILEDNSDDDVLLFDNSPPSFINTYNRIIKDIHKKLYTEKGKQIILDFVDRAEAYYSDLVTEVSNIHKKSAILKKIITN